MCHATPEEVAIGRAGSSLNSCEHRVLALGYFSRRPPSRGGVTLRPAAAEHPTWATPYGAGAGPCQALGITRGKVGVCGPVDCRFVDAGRPGHLGAEKRGTFDLHQFAKKDESIYFEEAMP